MFVRKNHGCYANTATLVHRYSAFYVIMVPRGTMLSISAPFSKSPIDLKYMSFPPLWVQPRGSILELTLIPRRPGLSGHSIRLDAEKEIPIMSSQHTASILDRATPATVGSPSGTLYIALPITLSDVSVSVFFFERWLNRLFLQSPSWIWRTFGS